MIMGRMWAVSRNVILEFIRLKGLLFFLALLTAVYTLGFAWWLHQGQGPVDEKVQTFISYSLSSMMVILSFLTIFISIATITRDIKRKEIFTIATKPISRGQYLIGKFLGLVFLNLILLIISSGTIYGVTQALARYGEPSAAEQARLNELVLIARKAVQPPQANFEKEALERTNALADKQIREKNMTDLAQIHAMRTKLYKDVLKALEIGYTAVAPGGHKLFHFSQINPDDYENGLVYIRYKLDVSKNPPDLKVYGQWLIGPKNPLEFGGKPHTTLDEIRTFHEFAVPVSDVSESGDLYVAFRNPVENAPVSIIFPPDTGIEALYVVDTFEANFLRALLAIFMRLVFLSVLGLAMGAWLSYPVAVLMVLIIFLMGVCSNFILDAMKWEAGDLQGFLIRKIMGFIPNLSAFDPVDQIETGRVVPWDLLGRCAGYMILIKGGILSLFGYVIFRFRELARVII